MKYRENFSIDEYLRKESEKIYADHSYITSLKKSAFEEFLENLRDKPKLRENLNKALSESRGATIEEWADIVNKDHHPPCTVSSKGGRWDDCPHHKNSGGQHGWGFCIYRTDYDIMQTKDRNCKFKKPTEKLPEELFEI